MSNLKPLELLRLRIMRDCTRRFRKDEDGSIIIFTLLLFVIVLVLGGMAVDFMRFESRRAALQSVADRAVLAGADLNQRLDGKEVVIDFFKKAGYEDNIIGQPRVSGDSKTSRQVSVDAAVDIPTAYLRLIGMDNLRAPATATAMQGVDTEYEVSLILDLSVSMGWDGGRDPKTGTNKSRMEFLKPAAISFVNKLLPRDDAGNIDPTNGTSISMVNYSASVNVGKHIFDQLNTEPTVLYDTSEWQAGLVTIATPGATLTPPTPTDKIQVVEPTRDEESNSLGTGAPVYTAFSHDGYCVDLPDITYQSVGLDPNPATPIRQVEYYDHRVRSNDRRVAGVHRLLCPVGLPARGTKGTSGYVPEFDPVVMPLSQDPERLIEVIDGLVPYADTSIYQGMKWGAAFLDPSTRSILKGAPGVAPKFDGVRPLNYSNDSSTIGADGNSTNQTNSAKVIVLMTDGRNFNTKRLKRDAADRDDEKAYESVLHRRYWYQHSELDRNGNEGNGVFRRPIAGLKDDPWPRSSSDHRENGPSDTHMDRLMQANCTAAKNKGIRIYTIAMNAKPNALQQMKDCASTNSFFNVQGFDIETAFDEIARQLTDLRLTQ